MVLASFSAYLFPIRNAETTLLPILMQLYEGKPREKEHDQKWLCFIYIYILIYTYARELVICPPFFALRVSMSTLT